MKTGKRIVLVTIRTVVDDSPDTSFLGKYSNKPTSEFSIDRSHALDCPQQTYNHQSAQLTIAHAIDYLQDISDTGTNGNRHRWIISEDTMQEAQEILEQAYDDAQDCNCSGHMCSRGEYQYFNPSFNYVDKLGYALPENTREDVIKYVAQDYGRMESLTNDSWSYIGIVAEAQILIPAGNGMGHVQRIDSSLWGIESDSDKDYINQTELELLSELKGQLSALGFSKRAISTAFKTIERKAI